MSGHAPDPWQGVWQPFAKPFAKLPADQEAQMVWWLAPASLAHVVERLALHLVQEGHESACAQGARRRLRHGLLQQPTGERLRIVVPARPHYACDAAVAEPCVMYGPESGHDCHTPLKRPLLPDGLIP